MPAEAPPTAPATPAAVPAAPPPTPPGATDGGPGSEIHVTPGTVDKGPKQEAPKKGSAMDRLMSDLRAKAKPAFYESEPDTSTPAQTPASSSSSPAGAPPEGAGNAQTQPPAPSPEEKKKNPWKLVDEYKAMHQKVQTELAELRKAGVDPAMKKGFEDQITKLKSQNEELEKHMRFVDYSKSAEFKSKYADPYEKAWERAAKEISQIRIQDPETGQERRATPMDLYRVVAAADLTEAQDVAEAMFGKFANHIMGFRKEIIDLNDAQQSALKDAYDNSIKRAEDQKSQIERYQTETADQIKQLWDQANAEFSERKDLAFIFKPADTDEDAKGRLSKGYELVDKAFALNSADPRLTPQQRAEAVKMHAAVRMRAAGFGPLRFQYNAALARISALEKELAQFKDTVPTTGGNGAPDSAPPSNGKAWDQIRAGLQKIARPVS